MLSLISFIILFLYLGLTFIKFGIPSYISDGYYQIKNKWLFTITMIIVSILLFFDMITLGNINLSFLSFFSIIGMLFLAVEPHYKNIWEGKIHKGAAIFAWVCSQLWCFINIWQIGTILWLTLGIILLIIYRYMKCHNINIDKLKLWYWVELFAFINVYLTILYLN